MTQRGCNGAGLGLRFPHIREVLREQPDVLWFEVHICNFMGGGMNRALLHQINEQYPLSFHGVSLNLAGVEPLDEDYLGRLKIAVEEFQPALISEHACFTTLGGHFFHDLLPVPFTEEAVVHLAARIRQVQDTLGRQIMIENLSRYYAYPESCMREGEFMAAVAQEADCGLLLDLNNLYVNQQNLGEDMAAFIADLPLERVGEIHLAGYTEQDGMLIDTHGSEVSDPVWHLYADLCRTCPDLPCLIEWDCNLPAFSVLQEQRLKAEAIRTGALSSVKVTREAG